MGYITVKKGSNKKLSEHFYSNEFDCHGIGCCTETLINEKLVDYLEKIREYFRKPVTLTSAFRCPAHNSSPTVKGSTGSRHTNGDAADIVITGVAPREVAKYAESIGIKGIGLYETYADGYFVHIDTRDVKSFWYGQACAARTTFGGASGATTTVTTPESKSCLLMVGSTGNAVRAMQENLVRLGYDLATDGAFGNLTKNAVMDYQKKNGLTVDGIAGSKTLTAIDESINRLGKEEYVVTASALNVRSGAGTNFKIVKTVNKNTVLTVEKLEKGWGFVGFGWVSMQYLRQKGR